MGEDRPVRNVHYEGRNLRERLTACVEMWQSTSPKQQSTRDLLTDLIGILGEYEQSASCVRPTVLRTVITEAMADVERTGMTGQTRDEWVSIAILGSSRIPLHSHFPAEGGGPCPHCGTTVFPPASTRDPEEES